MNPLKGLDLCQDSTQICSPKGRSRPTRSQSRPLLSCLWGRLLALLITTPLWHPIPGNANNTGKGKKKG